MKLKLVKAGAFFWMTLIFVLGLSHAGGGKGQGIKEVGLVRRTQNSDAVTSKKEHLLKTVLTKYRTNIGAKMDLMKEVTSVFGAGEPVKSVGRFFLSKGHFRMELGEDKENVLLMNGRAIYSIIKVPKELGGKLQVTKISFNQNGRRETPLYWFLVGDKKMWQEFQIVNEQHVTSGPNEVALEPINLKKYPEFKKIQFKLNASQDFVESIGFWDDLGSVTRYNFSNPKWEQRLDLSLFHFKAQKGQIVNEL